MDSIKPYTEQQIEQTIKEYILQEVMYETTDVVLSKDLLLLQNRILDSMSILQLQAFLEEKFNFTISSEEVLPENFETVNTIKSFVISKLLIDCKSDSDVKREYAE
jgi:acyl carrier protein